MRASVPSLDAFIGHELASELRGGVRYRLLQLLGEGGTAAAYLATRQAPDGESLVVVKIILPSIVAESDEVALTIIKKEAVALGRLNERVPPTPYVVRLIDTGSVPFQSRKPLLLPWIALEYVHGGVEGTTLTDRVEYSVRETGFAFDPERAARAIEGLAHGLSEIHAVGVVHRDLSPGNVLCCGSGETELFKISDFGIARPMGLAATFGDAIVGTPGYVALEQFKPRDGVPLGAHTDIFSLAAIVYFMLTGEHYFDTTSAGAALVAIHQPQRRSLLEARTLAYELREKQAACQAIDLALARATAADPAHRPQSARLFADSLLPWIAPAPTHRPSRRWMNSMARLRVPDATANSSWMIRHPPGDDRLVVSAAWNASGDCLATTLRGLEFWDGTRWAPAPAPGVAPAAVRCVRQLGPGSFLLGCVGATLIEYSRDGLRPLLRGPDESYAFTHATTDLDDVAVMVGERVGAPPHLFALVGKRWLRPLPVEHASSVSSLARLDDEHWLVVGRGTDGRPYSAVYRPLLWDIERLATPHGRALLACAGRPERAFAIAVGVDGMVVTLDRGEMRIDYLPGAPDLAAVAVDTLGRPWAAGPGRVWVRRLEGTWECVWQQPAWQVPFVNMLAEIGMVGVMTVDGAVLECRSGTLDNTAPAQ